MADITMCEDVECPLKNRCHRFNAIPNEYWQSYFTVSPKKMDGCDYYWPIESTEHEDRSRHRNNYESQKDSLSGH